MTLIQAIDALKKRGYSVAADPDPFLPCCSYYLQGNGVTYAGLTGATLRQYAIYGLPAS